MADVFEDRPELPAARERLWDLIAHTPNLDWLLLTKRPENVYRMVPWTGTSWPSNIWLGATVEMQEFAKPRLDAIMAIDVHVHFVSCEPLLEALDLRPWLGPGRLNWVIAGGESGPKARPMQPEWARALRDQCAAAGVPFHFKQWGDWGPQDGASLLRMGKKAAGRVLDGRTWDGFPVHA